MANKRDLKKQIRALCGDLASNALLASTFFGDKVDTFRLTEIIKEIAALQEDTLCLVTFGFDKSKRDYESKAKYRSEKSKYFRTAYEKLENDFCERILVIVKQLNDAVPEDVRKTVSSL